ncbi:plasmid mobilization relaxosome protein MobC [Enterococcus faecalis]|nr:plasmid mobilization relaxosome protein MobC [Enterococcus faecalis]EGO9166923.1 plasmid mobilization relaxosome protein MobC [Enterococcus faecalis]
MKGGCSMADKKYQVNQRKEKSSHTYKQVKFRLNEEEMTRWQEKANERNLSLPKFSKQVVEQAITHGKIKQPKIDKQQGADILKHLAKAGGNINQIAKWCNTHKEEVSDNVAERLAFNLEQVRKELNAIWQQLK